MQFGKTISIGTSVIKCGYVVCRSTADSVTRDDLSENFVTADMVILFVVSLCCVIAVIFLLLTCGICDISNGEVSGELPVSSQQKQKPPYITILLHLTIHLMIYHQKTFTIPSNSKSVRQFIKQPKITGSSRC